MKTPLPYLLNLALRFVLELCALGALSYWGSRAGGGPISGTALALGTPLVAAVAWGIFVAPRARVSLPLAGKLTVELAVFGSATAALYATGHHALATTLFIAAAANRALIHHWRQGERDRTDRAIP